MTVENSKPCCPGPEEPCCRVEALVSVDDRGQMVLPKDIREKAGIGPGDKLAIVSLRGCGDSCCLALVRADAITDMVRELLGPMMAEFSGGRDR
ncbi:MAG TPA: HgcAB-associated protein [Candidatus Fermentibacter sp.]|nr:HgcAB-associated protein [Candidatus Fermentibacter sp.]